MDGRFDSRHPLVGLVDETSRLTGRLKSLFAEARQSVGLNDSEIMVLNAVVEADHAPTVAQIGRSLGHARQLIQRAANSLREAGLIEMRANPDHKRAPLLMPTNEGIALKRRADALAEAIAERIMPALDGNGVREATVALRKLRKQLEARLRGL
ncbi:MAG: MarR family transcriptional regulator [Novosphingobium sp.]|nr:MarR family transcriptional regulator [Novosphingobium sp.]